MYFIGVDPGKTGAIAMLDEQGRIEELLDWPGVNSVDISRLYNLFKVDILEDRCGPEEIMAAVEKVTSYKMGRTGAFNFGGNFLAWQTALLFSRISCELVPPQRWKKIITLSKADGKKSSLIVARRRWPDAELHFAYHHGRADALLIAEWLRQKNISNKGIT